VEGEEGKSGVEDDEGTRRGQNEGRRERQT